MVLVEADLDVGGGRAVRLAMAWALAAIDSCSDLRASARALKSLA
jgi:hypothetical protein